MNRLTRLEDAHRALAAQHTALLEFCRAFLPLIQAAPEDVQKALVEVYDRTNSAMTRSAMDAEYQAGVRQWLDALSSDMTAADQAWLTAASTSTAVESIGAVGPHTLR